MLTRLAGFWFEQQTLQAVFYPNKLGLLADLILQVSKTSTYGDASRTLGCTFPRGAIRTASSGEIGCKDPPRTMQKAACKAHKFAENFGSESLLPCVCRSFPRGRSGKHFPLKVLYSCFNGSHQAWPIRIGRTEESTAWKESGPNTSFGAWVA